MAPSEYENQVQGLLDAGQITQEQADGLLDGSRLRQEVTEREQRLAAAEAENEKLRKSVLRNTFEKAGVNADPSILNLPKDLAADDPDAVRSWAIDKGLIAAPPDTSRDELATHDRIAAAASGAEELAGESDARTQYEAAIAAADNPDEVLAAIDKFGEKVGVRRAGLQ